MTIKEKIIAKIKDEIDNNMSDTQFIQFFLDNFGYEALAEHISEYIANLHDANINEVKEVAKSLKIKI